MRSWGAACAVVFTAAFSAVEASAQTEVISLPAPGRFTVSPHAGTAVHLEGRFMQSATESQVLNTQVGGQVFSTRLSFIVHEQRFSEAFHRPHKVGVDIDYGLSPLMELFGGVSYTRAQAKRFTALDVTFTGTVGGTVIVAGSEFLGEFHDYQEYAGTLGVRRFFDRESKVKPYIAAQVSARHVPAVDLRLFNEATGVQVDDIKFYDSTYTYSAGLRVGMRFDITDYAAIGLETGVTYFGGLRDSDDSLSGFNEFDDSNNDSDRFELPLTVRAVIRF